MFSAWRLPKPGRITIVGLGLFVLAVLAWQILVPERGPSGLPLKVEQHFAGLAEVEFCTVVPHADIGVGDLGHGLIRGYPILDERLGDYGEIVISSLKFSASPEAMACFNPRHAIREPGNPENWVLICFECEWLAWSFNGEADMHQIRGAGDERLNDLAESIGMRVADAKRVRQLMEGENGVVTEQPSPKNGDG